MLICQTYCSECCPVPCQYSISCSSGQDNRLRATEIKSSGAMEAVVTLQESRWPSLLISSFGNKKRVERDFKNGHLTLVVATVGFGLVSFLNDVVYCGVIYRKTGN
eukprot:m.259642 g.259642  ORF g.259642 m.259642 type:complete len:106 (+) comp40426_c1_seq4:4027-4344(+)